MSVFSQNLENLWSKLHVKEYREGYAESQIDVDIPHRLEALRRARGWALEDLAERSKVPLERLEAIESFETRPSVEDLLALAAAFDVGLMVKFAPFSELVQHEEDFDPSTYDVVSFAGGGHAQPPRDRGR